MQQQTEFSLPFIVAAMSMIHLLFQHQTGSNNPLALSSNIDKITFHPFYSSKDFIGFLIMMFSLTLLSLWNPYSLWDSENFTPVNPLVSPVHIQPEWYFIFAYIILRSIPNKLGEVIVLVMSILIPMIMPFHHKSKMRELQFYHINQMIFWIMVSVVILLTWIGARPVEDRSILTGQALTVFYFLFFLLVPLLLMMWDFLLTKKN